jgi:hypothetical protein
LKRTACSVEGDAQPVTNTVAIASRKKRTLNPMVTRKRVFSMPRRAVKKLPVSAPVNPPRPAPLLCNITLTMSEIDVIINAISRYTFKIASRQRFLQGFFAGGLYLSNLE